MASHVAKNGICPLNAVKPQWLIPDIASGVQKIATKQKMTNVATTANTRNNQLRRNNFASYRATVQIDCNSISLLFVFHIDSGKLDGVCLHVKPVRLVRQGDGHLSRRQQEVP